ncbi:DUF871 domain-containing protein [Enterococcus quebecensis]|uniref:Outer surface protein n=1 Tax=Enterococcus quebecensis TaxID=903983 RepID=A0A1E5GS57_9ENTE|nr:MupG family TIM beta-alpha barrel fold protein [Enterococcus quebecensis]OEG15538.1 hypothetical protein BCR23_08715 [Enterococcus quebecensis]OJG74680.1 hypothetical protein RV12_GL002435 [Enterococcus quebecensis]
MIKDLGISIYPEKADFQDMINYIKLARTFNFSKVFMSMLQFSENPSEDVQKYKEIIVEIKKLNMSVILDVNSLLLPKLDVTWKDLSFFSDLGVDILRLDGGFSGMEEMFMTHNSHNMMIELNMSSGSALIDRIMSFSPNIANLCGSYNFYPHAYTGMRLEDVKDISNCYHSYNVPSTIFVTSRVGNMGPWKMHEGLCTIEEHRFLPITAQIKQIKLLDLAETVIIGNAFASENELKKAAEELNYTEVPLDIEMDQKITENEKEILFSDFHFVRPEYSGITLRSAFSRHVHKQITIPARNSSTEIKKGSVLIDNNLYGQYECELHIVLNPEKVKKNRDKYNIIGQLSTADNVLLLDELAKRPYQKFSFKES